MKLLRFVKQAAGRTKPAAGFIGALLLVTALFGSGGAALAGSEASDTGQLLHLTRDVSVDNPVPGEDVDIRFTLFNGAGSPASVMVTEEIPLGLHVLDAGPGAYNGVARFVVWRVTVPAGEARTVGYRARVEEGAEALPLFAYATSSVGAAEQDEYTLRSGTLPVRVRLSETAVKHGETVSLHVELENLLDRAVAVEWDAFAAEGLLLSQWLPETTVVEAREAFAFVAEARALETGRYPVAVTPRIGGAAAGPMQQATLTVYGTEAERRALVGDEVPVATTPGEAVRTHRITFPDGVLVEGEQLVVTVPVPEGAAYIPDTAAVNGASVEDPAWRQSHLVFYVPSTPELVLEYALLFQDKDQIGDRAALEQTGHDLGVLSVGLVPRILRGHDGLVPLLQGETVRPHRSRQGVVLLNLFDGQIVGDTSQIDIEVDAPAGAEVTLRVNGEAVGDDRIGGIAEDAVLDREARKYIAVPLAVGANEITASAEIEAESLEDRLIVYRSGPPASISIAPLTELNTGRVRPLIFQIAAADENGLPPADGTLVTAVVRGAEVVSDDARPDWLGMQLALFGGRAYLEVEPPTDPTELVIEVQGADVEAVERYVVTTRVPDWSVLGHGVVRMDVPTDGGGDVVVHSSVRMLARGPLSRDAVLTVAVNTSGLEDKGDPTAQLWTGDTSTRGAAATGSGPLFLRLERGLSYAQYGRDTVEFDGKLAGFYTGYDGLHGVWKGAPGWSVRGFAAQVPVDIVQELFVGDGTGYFRLQGGPARPFSEELAVVVREPFYPHDVVRVLPLSRTRYYFDPNTGQILLAEPLPARDEAGNEVALRVRYRPLGDGPTALAAGLQGGYEADRWQVRGAFVTRPTDTGDVTYIASAGGQAEVGPFVFGLEAAHSSVHDAAGAPAPVEAGAYVLGASHKDVWGWALRAEHRRIEPNFVAADPSIQTGITSSLAAERTFDGRFNVSARTALSRDDDQAPTRGETTTRVRWLAGRLHPEAGLTVRGGEGISPRVSARVGVGASFTRGRANYAYEWPVEGQAPTRHTLEGQVELARHQSLLLNVDLTRTGPGQPFVAGVGLGLTHALVGERATTRIRGGYELPGHTNLSEGHYVLGASTDFKVNDRNTLLFSLDHRRPLLSTKPTGFGSSIGWRYNHLERGESEWRLDFRSQGDAAKHALQWRGLHPLGERWTLRGNVLLTTDQPGGSRLRAGLGAAYRQKDSALLVHVTGDNVTGTGGDTATVEWRIQGAARLSDKMTGSAGFALRDVAGSNTSKVNVGVVYELSEHFDLLAELTRLSQAESKTGLLGAMVGVSYELFEHFWLTAGYALDNYVGSEPGGAAFERRRSGVFFQFDIAFDEWSLRRLFTKKAAQAADEP